MSLAHQIVAKPSKLEQQKALLGGAKSAPQEPVSIGDYRQIELAAIKLDQSAQPRENLSSDKRAEYAQAMRAGDRFPALVVFEDATGIWLADGFHRHYAAHLAGIASLLCRVLPGGLRDAILYSVGANATHGVPRSDEDKRRAVQRLLADEEWSQWSDREIARRCRVSDKTVAKLRPKPSADDPQIKRKVERGGTVYKQKVAKATAQNAPKALANDEPSPEAGPQAEASLVGTDTGTPADREGRFNGEAASVVLPTIPDPTTEADAIQAEFDRVSEEGRALFLARNKLQVITERPSAAPVRLPVEKRPAPAKHAAQGPSEAEGSGAAHGPEGSPVSPPIKRKTAADYRPHCQRPEMCAASGLKHCHSCEKAIPVAESEAA